MKNQEIGTSRSLIALGALLFLLGLLSGFAIPAMTNTRMGLSSHLEGVMNGMFLMVVGLAWAHLRLAPRALLITYGCLVYGSFANWACVQLAAIFGTSEMTPIAGKGHAGSAWQESLVSAGLVSVGITMLIAGVLLVVGFWRAQDGSPNESPHGSL